MEILTDKVIYNTETQEDYDDLMEKLDKLGCVWFGGGLCKTVNYFPDYGNNTAIRVDNKEIFYGTLSHYLNRSKTLYEDCQIIKYKKEQKTMKVKLKADQKFIADWYEENKDDFEYAIYLAFEELNHPYIEDIFLSWLDDGKNEPIQTLVKMHIFGYEIEKEPLYYVVIPNPNVNEKTVHCYCLKKECSKLIIVRKKMHEIWNMDFKLTESEIKEDFEWAWDFARKVD